MVEVLARCVLRVSWEDEEAQAEVGACWGCSREVHGVDTGCTIHLDRVESGLHWALSIDYMAGENGDQGAVLVSGLVGDLGMLWVGRGEEREGEVHSSS